MTTSDRPLKEASQPCLRRFTSTNQDNKPTQRPLANDHSKKSTNQPKRSTISHLTLIFSTRRSAAISPLPLKLSTNMPSAPTPPSSSPPSPTPPPSPPTSASKKPPAKWKPSDPSSSSSSSSPPPYPSLAERKEIGK